MTAVEWTIVTMSRGDESRLAEWVTYHAILGFTRFHVVLDAPVDGSARVLRDVGRRLGLDIVVEERAPVGEYYDGLDPASRRKKILAWRERHREEIEERGLPINDVISWRQHLHLP